jgi:hypothetical protein
VTWHRPTVQTRRVARACCGRVAVGCCRAARAVPRRSEPGPPFIVLSMHRPTPCLPLLLSTMPPWVLSKATDRRSVFPLSPIPFFSSTPDAPPPTLLIVDDAATTLEPRATLSSVESRYGAVILLPSGELCCPHALPSLASWWIVPHPPPSSPAPQDCL